MDGKHIDLDYLHRFCKGDRSRMEWYIRLYLECSPELFGALAAKAGSGDAEGLAVAAHDLRPQVNYVGAQELFDLLTRIEDQAREQGTEACKDQVARIADLNARVLAELEAYLEADQ